MCPTHVTLWCSYRLITKSNVKVALLFRTMNGAHRSFQCLTSVSRSTVCTKCEMSLNSTHFLCLATASVVRQRGKEEEHAVSQLEWWRHGRQMTSSPLGTWAVAFQAHINKGAHCAQPPVVPQSALGESLSLRSYTRIFFCTFQRI